MNNILKLFLSTLLVACNSARFCIGLAPMYISYLATLDHLLKEGPHKDLLKEVDKDALLESIAGQLDETVYQLVALNYLKIKRTVTLDKVLDSINQMNDSEVKKLFENTRITVSIFLKKGTIPEIIFDKKPLTELDWKAQNQMINNDAYKDTLDKLSDDYLMDNFLNRTLDESFTTNLIRNVYAAAIKFICKYSESDSKKDYIENISNQITEFNKKKKFGEIKSPEWSFLDKMLTRIKEDELIIKELLASIMHANSLKEGEPNILDTAEVEDSELLLIDISLNNGDKHSDDGGVSILTFKYLGLETKLVYKTGPVRGDFLVMGNTKIYNEILKKINNDQKFNKLKESGKLRDYKIENSFIEIIINELSSENDKKDPKFKDSDKRAKFRMPKPYIVLPIEYQDNIEAKNSLPMKQIYGYIEFIEGDTLSDFFEAVDSKSDNPDINKSEQKKIMFQMAFINLIREKLLSTDMHQENMIIDFDRSRVTAIDLEVLLDYHNVDEHNPEDFRKMMNKIWNSFDVDKKIKLEDSHKNNELVKNKNPYDKYTRKLNRVLYRARNTVFEWLKSEPVKTMPIRHIVIGTSTLHNLIFNYPNIGHKIPPSAPFVINDNFKAKLASIQIPAFYARANDKALFDADGKWIEYNKDYMIKLQNDGHLYYKYSPLDSKFDKNFPYPDTFHARILRHLEKFFERYETYNKQLHASVKVAHKADLSQGVENHANIAIVDKGSENVKIDTIV